jgi:hypothetical protein
MLTVEKQEKKEKEEKKAGLQLLAEVLLPQPLETMRKKRIMRIWKSISNL